MSWLASIEKTSPHLNEKRAYLTGQNQLQYTIKEIGRGIKAGSRYVPIINHARNVASRAGPKDYLGQVKQLYDDFVTRWRYVRDPVNLETLQVSGRAIYGQVLGFNKNQSSGERGSGDCDESATAMGAMLEAIGFPTRLVTISPPGNRSLFSHVFVQAKVPKVGWYSLDPVGFPLHGSGWTPQHDRIAYWDKDGNLLGSKGRFPRSFRRMFGDFLGDDYQGEIDMRTQDFQDYGLGYYAGDDGEPADWALEGLIGFGAYSPTMGIIDGDRANLLMEFDEDDEINDQGVNVVRTKMLEMDPEDYRHAQMYGYPRMGAVALGDDGDVYQYTQDPVSGLGFFKKLFKRIKKRVKKAVRWVGSKAKRLIRRLPGGKYLLKLHGKIHKVAMKLVRPLTKFVGKYAKKLAPIAALIPGYGPAIAGALLTAGKIANTLKKYGVVTDKSGKPKFKSGKQAKQFQRALRREAQRMKRSGQAAKIIRATRNRRRARSLRGTDQYGGRLLKIGTPEHTAYLRNIGIDVPTVH